jgi:hypothetical protein
MYDNQSNTETTNIFETLSGVLNIAPIKISGQYKIVVDKNKKLWLDDYTGRRVPVDTTIEFLPQVCNFLKTKTICDSKNLKYGGYQKNNVKSYHIPFYLNTNEFPKYFILNRIVNENLPKENLNYLYKYGKLEYLVDLEKIGLHDIFDEIISESNYNFPLYFNWEDSKIDIFGLSVDSGIPTKNTINLIHSMANQPYFENLNNKILNTFKDQKIIFPKFINIEFEFDYSNNQISFNNFYGYLSKGNIITDYSEYNENNIYCKLKDYQSKIEYSQLLSFENLNLETFQNYLSTGTIQTISEKEPQFRFKTNNITINDTWKIYHPNNTIYFEYSIVEEDIITTSLRQSLILICKKLTKLSNYDFLFSAIEIDNYVYVTIKSNLVDDFNEEYIVEIPNNYIIVDRKLIENKNKFRAIKPNDIWLFGNINDISLFVNQIVKINNEIFTIVDIFGFDDSIILRLNENSEITSTTYIEIFENKIEIVLELLPINFLLVNSNLNSKILYDANQYIQNILTKFESEDVEIQSTIQNTVNDFLLYTEEGLYQYVNEVDNDFDNMESIEINDFNTDIIKNMIFTSIGHTSYITPNTLNIDKRFYQQNGNLDYDKLENDLLRFNWFLINSECPEYLSNDIRKLRYFNFGTELPKLTSKIVKINSKYCETIFLGVKYQFPIKYENYQFAVFINVNNKLDEELNYKFHLYTDENLLLLSVNKYLDFCDLIRGTNNDNPAFLDLSFFYYVLNSYNTYSDNLSGFKSGGIKLCQPFNENEMVLFNGNPVYDWKTQDNFNNWYICLRRENLQNITNDFTVLFPSSGNAEFYVYSEIEYQGEIYKYISMTVKIINIKELKIDYLWCEDIEIKFFDTEEIFINKLNINTNIYEIFKIEKNNILSLSDKNNNIFGDFHQIAVYLVDNNYVNFELLLTDKPIKLKEYYFEINTLITENELGEKTRTDEVFKFPEFFSELSDEEIIEQFQYDIDENIYEQKITIFDRNQVWRIIQDLFLVDLKFKTLSSTQVRNLINNFMITKLFDFTDVYSIPIDNPTSLTDIYIKLVINDVDRNIVVWNLLSENKLNLINRIKTSYYPYFELSENEFEFQLTQYKINQTLFNIYDNKFGGENINSGITATGLWQEVMGNIVSSLYCKTSNIEITIPFQKIVDIKNLLKQHINIEETIINNYNEEYISKIDANVNEYILENYTKYLLDNFYYLEKIHNELNQNLIFTYNKNTYTIELNNKWEYNTIFDNLIFVFVRK